MVAEPHLPGAFGVTTVFRWPTVFAGAEAFPSRVTPACAPSHASVVGEGRVTHRVGATPDARCCLPPQFAHSFAPATRCQERGLFSQGESRAPQLQGRGELTHTRPAPLCPSSVLPPGGRGGGHHRPCKAPSCAGETGSAATTAPKAEPGCSFSCRRACRQAGAARRGAEQACSTPQGTAGRIADGFGLDPSVGLSQHDDGNHGQLGLAEEATWQSGE